MSFRNDERKEHPAPPRQFFGPNVRCHRIQCWLYRHYRRTNRSWLWQSSSQSAPLPQKYKSAKSHCKLVRSSMSTWESNKHQHCSIALSLRHKTGGKSIIHGVCCARIKDAFFVVASLFEIIPVVHVRVDDEFKAICMNSMKKQYVEHLTWIDQSTVPFFGSNLPPYAFNNHNVQFTILLWTMMSRMIVERG